MPCAERVCYARNGVDVTFAGVKLARAYTGRGKIACYAPAFFRFSATLNWTIRRIRSTGIG
jgi:glutamate-1-semialdehyde aminotransferase